MKKIQGFTLIELMIVVAITALLAAIAIPSYDTYIRKKDVAVAKQEIQKLSTELERWKAKNFSYKGFDPSYIYPNGNKEGTASGNTVSVPAVNPRYVLTITTTDNKQLSADGAGADWVIVATRKDAQKGAKLPLLRMTSTGERCMNNAGISATSCGTNGEKW